MAGPTSRGRTPVCAPCLCRSPAVSIPCPEQVKLDVAYLEPQSLWLDLTLLLKTVPAVLLGRGAY
jgi:lipopolysaccharide/colanic/teichoic acid biosynthesis glycosyltransferase